MPAGVGEPPRAGGLPWLRWLKERACEIGGEGSQLIADGSATGLQGRESESAAHGDRPTDRLWGWPPLGHRVPPLRDATSPTWGGAGGALEEGPCKKERPWKKGAPTFQDQGISALSAPIPRGPASALIDRIPGRHPCKPRLAPSVAAR